MSQSFPEPVSGNLEGSTQRQGMDRKRKPGATDLFHRSDPKIYGLGNFTAHKTPGRTFFARLVLAF